MTGAAPGSRCSAASAMFAAGLLAGGLAGSMAVLVAARALQGIGGGIISVSLYVVAGQAYAPSCGPGCSPRSPPPGCSRR